MSEPRPQKLVGRYALFSELASGGMATVHLARLLGEAGFARTVAVKRLHPNYAKDKEFVSMFLDEARLAARIRHPNVVPVLDIVAADDELLLVMEFVQGEALSSLLKLQAGRPVAPNIAAKVACDLLYGLHAAHEARNERGEPLNIVHRDVSPQNLLVGLDGVSRVTDFGIAKASNRIQTTQEGQIKGKLAYMSPEQFRERPMDRRADVYAASIVLWEMLSGRRLFAKSDPGATVNNILRGAKTPPSAYVNAVPKELDLIVMRGLAVDPAKRYPTAQEMAVAIERAFRPAPAADVGAWVEELAEASLSERVALLADLESVSTVSGVEAARAYASRLSVPEDQLDTGRTSNPGVSEPVNSNLSSANVARSMRPGPPIQRRTLWIAAGALACVLGLAAIVVIVVVRVRAAEPTVEAAAPDPVPELQSPATGLPTAAMPVASGGPSVVQTPASEILNADGPDASAQGAISPPVTARAPAQTAKRPTPRPASKPTPRPAPKPTTGFGSLSRE